MPYGTVKEFFKRRNSMVETERFHLERSKRMEILFAGLAGVSTFCVLQILQIELTPPLKFAIWMFAIGLPFQVARYFLLMREIAEQRLMPKYIRYPFHYTALLAGFIGLAAVFLKFGTCVCGVF